MIHSHDKMTCKIAMQLIGGISQSTASRYILQVRKFFNKESYQIVTVAEFCKYYGIDYSK